MKSESDNYQFIYLIELVKKNQRCGDYRTWLNSLRDKIKELRNNIKICLEKIKILLNTILNSIIKR